MKNPLDEYKESIRRRFNAASQSYDEVAYVQKQTAEVLVAMLQAVASHLNPTKVLDVGTGTGYAAQVLMRHYPFASYTLNDISKDMLERAKTNLESMSASQFNFCEADMEDQTALLSNYDLTISNMAIQWADDLETLISKLYNQSQVLVFTCPLYGTFREWSALLEHRGLLAESLHDCPMESDIRAILAKLKGDSYVEVREYPLEPQSIHSFMHYLKKLGASFSSSRIESPHKLAELIKDRSLTLQATYKILFCVLTRS